MMARQLKELLSRVDDDVDVVLEGFDHSYNRVWTASEVEAESHKHELFEYHGKDYMCDEDNKVVKVFVLT